MTEKEALCLPVADPLAALFLPEGEFIAVHDREGRAWRTGFLDGRHVRQRAPEWDRPAGIEP